MKKIICLGDSITDAGRLFSPNGLGQGYVNELALLLEGQGTDYTITNRGVDGFTIARLLETAERDCMGQDPDIITMLIGVNDIGVLMNTRTDRQERLLLLREFIRSCRLLLSWLQSHTKAQLFLLEPFIFPWPQEYVNWHPYLDQLSSAMKEQAKDARAVWIPLQEPLLQLAKGSWPAVTEDGIHLTGAGHKLAANALFQALKDSGCIPKSAVSPA